MILSGPLTTLKLSNRLKSRLCAIVKYAICSILILGLIIATLSLTDHYTGEAYHLINHQIYSYSRRNLYWDRELHVEKVIQIVGLPIPCSLIFVIFEFIMEIYEIINNAVYIEAVNTNNVVAKNKIKELKSELMRVYDIHDEDVGKTHEFINELRRNQIENILERLHNDELKEEYLRNLLSYNRYVLEVNRHCSGIDEASL